MLKNLAINLSILFTFLACNSPQFKDPLYRRVWSKQFGCLIQKYSINDIKNLEDFYEVDDSYCDDLIGFSVEDWAKHITPTGRELRKWGAQECDNR
jgi:hypothetical protein